jgi:hypothetical protein
MVCGLVDDGVWAKLDLFYLFAQEVNSGGEALKNWILPGTYDAVEVANGGALTFTSLEGFTGDGSAYLNSNWDPSNNGVNYTLNDSGLGAYMRLDRNANEDAFGTQQLGNRARLRPRGAGITNNNMNDNAAQSVACGDSRGLFILQRTASNVKELFRNGVSFGAHAGASSGLSNIDMFILANNGNGSPISISQNQISVFFAGSSFTLADRTNLQNRIETYMDSNGKGVIP